MSNQELDRFYGVIPTTTQVSPLFGVFGLTAAVVGIIDRKVFLIFISTSVVRTEKLYNSGPDFTSCDICLDSVKCSVIFFLLSPLVCIEKIKVKIFPGLFQFPSNILAPQSGVLWIQSILKKQVQTSLDSSSAQQGCLWG